MEKRFQHAADFKEFFFPRDINFSAIKIKITIKIRRSMKKPG